MTEVEIKGNGKAWVVKNWHVLLLLGVQLLGLAAAYGSLRQQQDDNAQVLHDTIIELHKIEERPVVTESEWNSWRSELLDRLNRVENKLDMIK